MLVRRVADAAVFSARVAPWLLRREEEHGLMLGLLPDLASGRHRYASPVYLGWIEDDGEVVGCALRTPPFKLLLTRMPDACVDAIADDVASVYPRLPAVLGPEPEATAFGRRWARRSGCVPAMGVRQRLYRLDRVAFPERLPGGSLRRTTDADVAQIVAWMRAFGDETGGPIDDPRRLVDDLHRDGDLFVWDAEGPRAMVAVRGRTAHGARVAYVYTPPRWRRAGHATAACAVLSDRLLREGRRFCILYANLADSTATGIYVRLGYRPVCDVVDVVLDRDD